MHGETDLGKLLAGLDPARAPGRWRFAVVDAAPPDALMTFRETEGITAILAAAPGAPAFAMLTLRVISSLHAVGLTAAVASRLAAEGIAANVVAACHHDHVFVPEADADRAMASLQALSTEARGRGRAAG
jgi:hypothetical protein